MNQFHFHTHTVALYSRDEEGDIILSQCTIPSAASWWSQQTPTLGCKCWSFTVQQRITYPTTARTLSFTGRWSDMKFWSASKDVNLELPTSTTLYVRLLLFSLIIYVKTTQLCELKKRNDCLQSKQEDSVPHDCVGVTFVMLYLTLVWVFSPLESSWSCALCWESLGTVLGASA